MRGNLAVQMGRFRVANLADRTTIACDLRLEATHLDSPAHSHRFNQSFPGWRRSPDGKILKSDVSVAKNYLPKDALAALGRIVNAFLGLAEEWAQRKISMTMRPLA